MDEPNMFDTDDDYDTNELRFYIRTIQGDSMLFTVTKDTKIEDFEKKYRKEMKMKSKCGATLDFLFLGRKLDKSKTFADYNICQEDIIHLLMRIGGC